MRPYTILVLAMAAATQSQAQQRKTLAGTTGTLFRYSGDTIWQERDTTVNRTIYRGDTVTRERIVNGRRMNQTTYVLVGDSARFLFSIDSAGARHEGSSRLSPAMIVMSARDMLSRQLTSPIATRTTDYVPLSPATPISYCIDGSRKMIQHGDTARDVRTVGTKVDTTIYVFVGDTTVKRVSPNPTSFGYAMYTTLVGEMHMSVVRRNLASRNPPPAGLPGRSVDACNP
jgi:hypothetical protein